MSKPLFRLSTLLLFAVAASAEVTYSREVSRILQSKCQQCHRPGDIAPMSLLTYDDAVNYADDIKRVVDQGIMPPWKPSEGAEKFKGAFNLSDQEKTDLLAWLANGTPLGDPADMPEPTAPKGDWVLGDPDLVLKMPQAFTPARGKDVYRCFVLPTGIEEDKWVTAIDILPGNRKEVHHVILYLDSTDQTEKLDAADPEPGYDCYGGPGFALSGNLLNVLVNGYALGGWAPGARPERLPTGIGMKLGKNVRIVMQVHYNTLLRAGEDQTSIGLYFSQEPIKKQLFYLPVVNTSFKIPAGNASYVAKAQFPVVPGLEMQVINVFPHMHLLGTKIEVESEIRGEKANLITINNWDFNWQGAYTFNEAIPMPAFGLLNLRCTFDNSINNPKNPNNPLKDVRWGEGTTDEMCLALLGVTFNFF